MTREERLDEIADIVRQYDTEFGPFEYEIAEQVLVFLETGVSPRKPSRPLSELLEEYAKHTARQFEAWCALSAKPIKNLR